MFGCLIFQLRPHYRHQQFVIISRSWLVTWLVLVLISDNRPLTAAAITDTTEHTDIYFLPIPTGANKQDWDGGLDAIIVGWCSSNCLQDCIIFSTLTWRDDYTNISQLRSRGCPNILCQSDILCLGRIELFKVWNWCLYLPQLNSRRPADRETPVTCQGLGMMIWLELENKEKRSQVS